MAKAARRLLDLLESLHWRRCRFAARLRRCIRNGGAPSGCKVAA
jgi:hypothetical protein